MIPFTGTPSQLLLIAIGAALTLLTGLLINRAVRDWRLRDEADHEVQQRLRDLVERGVTLACEAEEAAPVTLATFRSLGLPRFKTECELLAEERPMLRDRLNPLAIRAGDLLRAAAPEGTDPPAHLVVRQALALDHLKRELAETRRSLSRMTIRR
jgi:hypothetical protein